MSDPVGHVVIVGAGIGGLRTAEQLRRRGYPGRITLIGAEDEHPYDRPPLSKEVLRGERPVVRLRAPEAYPELQLDLRLGQTVTGLDPMGRKVHLADDSSVDYDVLVLALGAQPRRLASLDGIAGTHVLRTAEDSAALRDGLADAASVAVVGGGFVGCEVAASIRTSGRDVTMIELLEAPLVGVLGRDVAAVVTRLHESAGVRIRCGSAVTEAIVEDRLRGVRLADGSAIAADVVVVGLGVVPATAWLAGTGVHLLPDAGVQCDEFGRTALPDVFAVGDCAAWRSPRTGTHRRVEHWTNATEHAAVVAQNIIRGAAVVSHDTIPYFWSDQYHVKIQSLGTPSADSDVEILPVNESGGLAVYGRDGVATAAVGFSCAPKLMRLRPLLAANASFGDVVGAAAREVRATAS